MSGYNLSKNRCDEFNNFDLCTELLYIDEELIENDQLYQAQCEGDCNTMRIK